MPIAEPSASFGSMSRFCASAAGQQHRLGGEIGGRCERHRRQRATEFLGQHAEALVAQAGAAVLFGDGRTKPAHLGYRPP